MKESEEGHYQNKPTALPTDRNSLIRRAYFTKKAINTEAIPLEGFSMMRGMLSMKRISSMSTTLKGVNH